MYSLIDVHKRYENTSVLRSVSCEIPTDGFVFIMGPSGAGKSTLLRLLSFIETPEQGVVHLRLNGTQFDSDAAARPWPRVTCVFQKQFLWPHLTLRENITLPLRAKNAPDIETRLRRVVDMFEMSSFIDRFPNEVSGGQAQRGALARALALEPQLILIDEAHGGLDLAQQKILNDYFIKLRQAGVGLIVVTHSIEFAQKYADKVLIVENGEIAEIGSQSIFDKPKSTFLRRVMDIT